MRVPLRANVIEVAPAAAAVPDIAADAPNTRATEPDNSPDACRLPVAVNFRLLEPAIAPGAVRLPDAPNVIDELPASVPTDDSAALAPKVIDVEPLSSPVADRLPDADGNTLDRSVVIASGSA